MAFAGEKEIAYPSPDDCFQSVPDVLLEKSSGRSWPGRVNAGLKLVALNRLLERIGAAPASRNRNVTTADGFWPVARVRPASLKLPAAPRLNNQTPWLLIGI
jgi:hypothetical protein